VISSCSHSNMRETEGILFSVDASNTFSVWAPLNSWEPHILYQRASIRFDSFDDGSILSNTSPQHSIGLILDSGELTTSLERFFNQCDPNSATKETYEIISNLARKAPTLFLSLSPRHGKLYVWNIDVIPPSDTLISHLSRQNAMMESPL
jgi:hypothetical protein